MRYLYSAQRDAFAACLVRSVELHPPVLCASWLDIHMDSETIKSIIMEEGSPYGLCEPYNNTVDAATVIVNSEMLAWTIDLKARAHHYWDCREQAEEIVQTVSVEDQMMDYVSICTLAVLAEETDENLTEILHSRLMEQLESSFDYKKSKGPHQGATTSDLLHAVAKKIAVKCYQVVRTRLTYGNFDMASTITKAVIWNLAKKNHSRMRESSFWATLSAREVAITTQVAGDTILDCLTNSSGANSYDLSKIFMSDWDATWDSSVVETQLSAKVAVIRNHLKTALAEAPIGRLDSGVKMTLDYGKEMQDFTLPDVHCVVADAIAEVVYTVATKLLLLNKIHSVTPTLDWDIPMMVMQKRDCAPWNRKACDTFRGCVSGGLNTCLPNDNECTGSELECNIHLCDSDLDLLSTDTPRYVSQAFATPNAGDGLALVSTDTLDTTTELEVFGAEPPRSDVPWPANSDPDDAFNLEVAEEEEGSDLQESQDVSDGDGAGSDKDMEEWPHDLEPDVYTPSDTAMIQIPQMYA